MPQVSGLAKSIFIALDCEAACVTHDMSVIAPALGCRRA
jgi:hypothetical protein